MVETAQHQAIVRLGIDTLIATILVLVYLFVMRMLYITTIQFAKDKIKCYKNKINFKLVASYGTRDSRKWS